jgi:hypothetical protein
MGGKFSSNPIKGMQKDPLRVHHWEYTNLS